MGRANGCHVLEVRYHGCTISYTSAAVAFAFNFSVSAHAWAVSNFCCLPLITPNGYRTKPRKPRGICSFTAMTH